MLVLLLHFPSDWVSHAFAPTSTDMSRSSVLRGSKSELSFEELTKLASDPKAFEAYALGKMKQEKKSDEVPKPTAKKQNAYVPIEEWDANRKKDDMSWEEKLQFEGQRDGNKFRQNEILRHNLNGF